MPTIDDAVKNTGAIENEFDTFAPPIDNPLDEGSVKNAGFNFDISIIFTKTGAGEIENYVVHPLNFAKSMGFAQLLRGLTGFAEALFNTGLDLAIFDVVLGIMNISKEKRGVAEDGFTRGTP